MRASPQTTAPRPHGQPVPRQPAVRRAAAAALLAVCLAPAGASAAVLDLLAAYRAALQHDATLRAAQAAADAQRERLPLAQAQLRPNISIGGSYARNDLTRTQANFLGQPVTQDDRYASHNLTLSVRQPLYRPALWAALDQARAQVDEAESTLQSETLAVADRVTTAYLQVLLAVDEYTLLQRQLQVAQTQLSAAQRTYELGMGVRTDADEVQARLDSLRADALRARQNLDWTLRQLRNLTQQPVDQIAALDPNQLQPQWPEPPALDDWLQRARQHNPQLQALRAQEEAARHALRQAQANHSPTLDAVAQITRSASENVTAPRSRYTNQLIGVQFNLPLYAGGGLQAAERQAQANWTRAQEALQAAQRELELRVHREYRNVIESAERMRALEQAQASAAIALESSRRSHEAGVRTLLDVLNADQQLQVARRNLAQARYEHLLARVRLRILVNDDIEQEIAAINAALIAEPVPSDQARLP